jgi:hypothetical protein
MNINGGLRIYLGRILVIFDDDFAISNLVAVADRLMNGGIGRGRRHGWQDSLQLI